ncbi:MAG: DsbA family protein [Planctomycetota bacterium]
MGPSWGIAADEWEALLASPEIADDVRRDVEEGNRLDLAGVPAVFRNGRRVLEMRLLPK